MNVCDVQDYLTHRYDEEILESILDIALDAVFNPPEEIVPKMEGYALYDRAGIPCLVYGVAEIRGEINDLVLLQYKFALKAQDILEHLCIPLR